MNMQAWDISLFTIFHVVLAATVSMHIVLTKPDVRAAIGWVGLVWLAPVVGSALYALFGINRIRREAGRMRRGRVFFWTQEPRPFALLPYEVPLPKGVPQESQPLATLVCAVAKASLVGGNGVDILVNGDEAYPVMLDAIDNARTSIALPTYIFDRAL